MQVTDVTSSKYIMKAFSKYFAIALNIIFLATIPLAAYSHDFQPPEILTNKGKASQKPKQIPHSRIGIGGINLFTTSAQVKRMLGQPQRVENSQNQAIGKVRTFKYRDIIVDLVEATRKPGSYFVLNAPHPSIAKGGDSVASRTRHDT